MWFDFNSMGNKTFCFNRDQVRSDVKLFEKTEFCIVILKLTLDSVRIMGIVRFV